MTKTEILVIFHETTPILRVAIQVVAEAVGGSYLDHAEPSVMWVSDLPLTAELLKLSEELDDLVHDGHLKIRSVMVREVNHD